jgi:iron complex outermembrane receptor protein
MTRLKNSDLKQILVLLFILCSIQVNAQTDSIKNLNEVTVKGYYNPQPLLRAVGSVSILDSSQAKYHSNSALISLVNTASGVRMEERSPGSYRLSLRGSLLRSPFGIRNIKIYINDFPFTDAGGNTYLNSLDANAIARIEIYKGPEASIFGANTGGAVLIGTPLANSNQVNLGLTAGSFGLLHQTASINQVYQNYKFNLTQGYQQSNGYRENSALKRKYIQTSHLWDYSAKGQLKAFVFYSDLNYQTPGGLTAAQLAQNPKAARPATPTLPGAVTQQAAIYNKTFFGGLSNSLQMNANLKHVMAFFTSYTDFKNPFITNYEKRNESTIGLRTFLEYTKSEKKLAYHFQLGLESLRTKTNIKNFKNDKGIAGSLTADDNLSANQNFAFLRLNFDVNERLLLELGSSLNFYGYDYQSYFPLIVATKEKTFKTSLMPKIALSYLIHPNFTIRASASKGYSAPTLAEVRSSDQIINTNLQAEAGWNYETGLRLQSANRRFNLDGTLFHFNLRDAIVRRLNTNDVEYFINAGGTKQLGTEVQLSAWLIEPQNSHFLNGIQLRNSYTYSHFRFDNFQNGIQNYSGNKLTGVPTQNIVSSLLFNFSKSIYLFAQHNYTSVIPLNDANTSFANSYHLLDLKAGVKRLKLGTANLGISFGINNLFNQRYSLGNDLNAANNRYFNPAAGINFDFGITVSF